MTTMAVYQFRPAQPAAESIRKERLQVQAQDHEGALDEAAWRLARRYGEAKFAGMRYQGKPLGLLLESRDHDGNQVTWLGRETVKPHWCNGFYKEENER